MAARALDGDVSAAKPILNKLTDPARSWFSTQGAARNADPYEADPCTAPVAAGRKATAGEAPPAAPEGSSRTPAQ
jgi:hypothetical protein